MDSLMISQLLQKNIFGVLSAVLHLGNIEFQGREEATIVQKSSKHVDILSKYATQVLYC